MDPRDKSEDDNEAGIAFGRLADEGLFAATPSPHVLPFTWGEGWGEGRLQAPVLTATPHPNPLPARGERGRGDNEPPNQGGAAAR